MPIRRCDEIASPKKSHDPIATIIWFVAARLKAMIKGTDFKSYSGQHRLMADAEGSGTVVMSEIRMDAGMMMPRFLIDEKVGQFLDEFGKALEKRVAGTAFGTTAKPAPARTGRRPAARRLLRITRTATGIRTWYLGQTYDSNRSVAATDSKL